MTKVRENQPLFIVRLQRGENKPPLSHNAVKVIATERREGASDMLCQSLQCQCRSSDMSSRCDSFDIV